MSGIVQMIRLLMRHFTRRWLVHVNLIVFSLVVGVWVTASIPKVLVACATFINCGGGGGGGGGGVSPANADDAASVCKAGNTNSRLDQSFGKPVVGSCCNDPFTTNDGTFYFTITDFYHPRGPGFPFLFQRSYNSKRTSVSRSLGEGWMTNYDDHIFLGYDPHAANNVTNIILSTTENYFSFTTDINGNPTSHPAGFFGTLNQITNCSLLPSGVLNHPNKLSSFVGCAGDPKKLPFKTIYVYVDKFHIRTFYAVIKTADMPGEDAILKPIFRDDNFQQEMQLIYESYRFSHNTQSSFGGCGCGPNPPPNCPSNNQPVPPPVAVDVYKTRLSAVHAGPNFPWSLTFTYYGDTSPSMLPVIHQPYLDIQLYNGGFLNSVTSNIGDNVSFSFPSTAGLPFQAVSPTLGQFDFVYRHNPDFSGIDAKYKSRIDDTTTDVVYCTTGHIPLHSARAEIIEKHDPYDEPGHRNVYIDFVPGSDMFQQLRNMKGQLISSYQRYSETGGFVGQITNSIGVERQDHYSMASGSGVRVRADYPSIPGAMTTYDYNSDLQITRLGDGNGHSQEFDYDSLGNTKLFVDGDGNSMTMSYDYASRVTDIYDFMGNHTSFNYYYSDLFDIFEPLGKHTKFQPQPNHLFQSITDANGHTTQFTYDSNGNLSSVQPPDPTIPATQVHFDNFGHLNSITDALGSQTTLSVMNDGRLRYIKFQNGSEIDLGYGGSMNVTSITNQNSHATVYTVDSDDWRTDIYEGNGTADQRHTAIEYDPQMNVKKVTDGRLNITSFSYFATNQVHQVTDMQERQKTYSYDGALNLFTIKDERNITTTYNRYKTDRVSSLNFDDGLTSSISYVYDKNGDISSMTDAEGTKTFIFDALRRLSKTANVALGLTTGYGFDPVGNVTGMGVRGSLVYLEWAYPRNAMDRVTDLKYQDAAGAAFETTHYDYNSLGQITAMTYPGGVAKAIYSYEAQLHRLTEVANVNNRGEIISRFGYAYDLAGNVTSTASPRGVDEESYDAVEQLTDVVHKIGGSSVPWYHFHYDASGNRDVFNVSGLPAQSPIYDTLNQMGGLNGLTFNYDNAGNLQSKSPSPGQGTNYFWDALNRLKEVDAFSGGHGGPIATYKFDGNNMRVRKIDGSGTVTNYLHDGLRVLVETDGSGAVKKSYNPGVSMTDGKGNRYLYLFNGHGDVADMIDKDGNIVQSYEYSPLGELIGGQDKFGGLKYVGLGGTYADDDIGMQNMWNRWMDPQVGRFISRDPSGVLGGVNVYDYAANNPLRYLDPWGLSQADVEAAIYIAYSFEGNYFPQMPKAFVGGIPRASDEAGTTSTFRFWNLGTDIYLNEMFWDPVLSDSRAELLLETVFHELYHYNDSTWGRMTDPDVRSNPNAWAYRAGEYFSRKYFKSFQMLRKDFQERCKR